MAGQPWAKYSNQSSGSNPSGNAPWLKYASPSEPSEHPESMSDTLLGKAREFADATADSLPAIGGIVGGVLGTPADLITGPAGTVGGAAIGGALGKAGQNLYNSYLRPELAPKENSDYLTEPLTEGAIQGALQGVGNAIPVAARAVASSPVGKAVGKVLSPVGEFIAKQGKSALGKLGELATGVDKDAALRQLERPAQTAAMQGEDAVYNLGQKGLQDVQAKGAALGKGVGKARDELIKSQGSLPVAQSEIDEIVKSGENFLKQNKPSGQGYSALNDKEREAFSNLLSDIKSGNVEDFVKIREHLDQVENLAQKYGSGSLTAYERQLMSMRGQMNDVLKRVEPKFKSANEAFENFKNQTSTLGLNSESRAESLFDNLYGANKTAKQKAAEGLLSPETLESAKDIAANKTFSNAKGPAGSEFGLRNMVRVGGAIPTGGLSILLTSPKAWQGGLRGLGSLGQKLGTYGPMLEKAAEKSPQALNMMGSLLLKDPEFRKQMEIDEPLEPWRGPAKSGK